MNEYEMYENNDNDNEILIWILMKWNNEYENEIWNER